MIGNIVAAITDGGEAATDFESIATVTVGAGGQAEINFTSIPGTYQHLQIRGISQRDSANTNDETTRIQFNNDTGNNYAYHSLYGQGSVAAPLAGSTQAHILTYGTPGGNSVAFAGFVMDILDYKNTNKFKTVRGLNGFDQNATPVSINFFSGLWQSTSAITSIKIFPNPGNWKQYTHFALYGIKG